MGRVAVIIGRGLQAANRGPCQCLRFRTLWLPVPLLCNGSLYKAAGSVPCVVYCSARGAGAGSNLAAVCQPILVSQRQSLPRQHSPPPSCASSGCLSMNTCKCTGRNWWASLICVSANWRNCTQTLSTTFIWFIRFSLHITSHCTKKSHWYYHGGVFLQCTIG